MSVMLRNEIHHTRQTCVLCLLLNKVHPAWWHLAYCRSAVHLGEAHNYVLRQWHTFLHLEMRYIICDRPASHVCYLMRYILHYGASFIVDLQSILERPTTTSGQLWVAANFTSMTLTSVKNLEVVMVNQAEESQGKEKGKIYQTKTVISAGIW